MECEAAGGETDLAKLLAALEPRLCPEAYVFCGPAAENASAAAEAWAIIDEDEGRTLILIKAVADRHALKYIDVFRRITLSVHSSLKAVGLTAAVATALAERGISANVVAGLRHDHVFVPETRAEGAVRILRNLCGRGSMDYLIKETSPTSAEYNSLREAVGWKAYDLESIDIGLRATLFCVCAYDGEKIIGMGRVIGDGRLVFYIQDIIVLPDYQRRNIGTRIMERIMSYIDTNAVNNSIVGLMSALGKEAFYEKFGFIRRPNEKHGCGMIQFVKR